MAAALKAPERVSKLIVADIAPVDYDAQHAGWRANHIIMDSLVELPKETLASRAEADAAMSARMKDITGGLPLPPGMSLPF